MTQETEAAVEAVARAVLNVTWKREQYNGVTADIDHYREDGPQSMGGLVERYEREALTIARAAIAAHEATLRPAIEAEIGAWLRDSACTAFCDGEDRGDEFQYCADAIERGDYRQQKGSVDGK